MTKPSLFRRMFGPKDAIEQTDSSKIIRGTELWSALTGSAFYSSVAPLDEGTAYTIPAVSACTQIIAGSIAGLPLHVYRRGARGDLTRDYKSPLWWVLNEQFSPRWTAASGWAYLVASKLLHGDAFAEIRRKPSGQIDGLVPIHPARVSVITDPEGERLIYDVAADPTITNPSAQARLRRVIHSDDMLHVPGFGFNGRRGLSMLQFSLRTAGAVSVNAQTFAANFLKNQARPDFALKTPANLKDEQFARLQEFLNGHQGPTNAGRPMILEGGLEIQTLTMPMEDVQLLETRKFGVEEIARAFMVPPFMIGHTEKTSSWGSGVAEMGSGFVRYTLRDHLTAFHNEINRKFFPRGPMCVEFDTMELERGDTKTMFAAIRTALGRAGEPAFMTVEEARELARLPREMPESEAKPNPAPAPGTPPAPDPMTDPENDPEDKSADPADDPQAE